MVNFKIYVTDWTKSNYNTLILPNISRNKDNQTIKFDQLIEYNMRNIFFLKKNYTQNVVEKLAPDTSTNFKSKLSIFLDEQSEM